MAGTFSTSHGADCGGCDCPGNGKPNGFGNRGLGANAFNTAGNRENFGELPDQRRPT